MGERCCKTPITPPPPHANPTVFILMNFTHVPLVILMRLIVRIIATELTDKIYLFSSLRLLRKCLTGNTELRVLTLYELQRCNYEQWEAFKLFKKL